MKIYELRRLAVRTVTQERGGPVLARVGILEGDSWRVHEDLTHHDALELGAALFGFGMSRNPEAHLAEVMADFQALMVKHTGKAIALEPFAPRSTDGH